MILSFIAYAMELHIYESIENSRFYSINMSFNWKCIGLEKESSNSTFGYFFSNANVLQSKSATIKYSNQIEQWKSEKGNHVKLV